VSISYKDNQQHNNRRIALLYDSHLSPISTKDELLLSKIWLSNCLASHKTCKSDQRGKPPTRLIEISDEGAQLSLSTKIDGSPQYATLSHC
jgi:hypothetical protein